MKVKIIITTCLILLNFNILAATISIKTPQINGNITTSSNLEISELQAVLSCHFGKTGARKESKRYILSNLKFIAPFEYSLRINKGSLFEILPSNMKLLTCAYKLIVIGKNLDLGKAVFNDLFLIGQEYGEMSEDELAEIQDENYLRNALEVKTRNLNFSISQGGKIVIDN